MKTPDFVADIKVDCKTIEDIKKWLACWAVTYTDECSGECETCEYDVGEKESVGMGGKTIAYIIQLEDRNKKLENALRNLANSSSNAHDAANKVIEHLESRLAQAERERDAAVRDLTLMAWNADEGMACSFCGSDSPIRCEYCKDRPEEAFIWRGVCEENTKEE